tara:strand:- start:518 stop:850 length:333 start_codon:yes stop_codon:yes gene_type:complete
MPFFIKTERFNKEALQLSHIERKAYIAKHIEWISNLKLSKIKIFSGYLINKNKEPGGGGLLLLKAESYQNAFNTIKQDPMIINNLVIWELNEWVSIEEDLSIDIIEDMFS